MPKMNGIDLRNEFAILQNNFSLSVRPSSILIEQHVI